MQFDFRGNVMQWNDSGKQKKNMVRVYAHPKTLHGYADMNQHNVMNGMHIFWLEKNGNLTAF